MHAAGLASAGRVLVRSVGRGFLVAVEVEGLPFWLRCNRPLAWAVEAAPPTQPDACPRVPDASRFGTSPDSGLGAQQVGTVPAGC